MKRALTAAMMALCSLSAGAAQASEASEALSARGLIEMHANHLEQARDLFQRALEVDPSDLDTRYYYAVVAAQLGDTDTAITNLRMVLEARPTFNEAALELGTIFTEQGWYSEATRWLEQAQSDPRLDARASFTLGLAQLRLQQLQPARENFRRARERDPSFTLASHYYEGVADYRAGNTLRAFESFTYVQENSPDSAMGAQATAFLSLLRRGRIGKYSLYAALGFAYDSNVVLAPNNQLAGSTISGQSDGSFNINAGGIFVPWETDELTLSVGYDFFQSLYFQLTDFDLQDNRFLAQLVWNPGPAQIGILGGYDYYLLETSTLFQDINGLLWLRFPEEGFGQTDASFRTRGRNSPSHTYRPLNGFTYTVHVGQAIDLGSPERVFLVGLLAETDNTSNFKGCTSTIPPTCGQYSYDAIQVEAGFGWRFNPGLDATIGYIYRNSNYAGASGSFQPIPPGQLIGPPRHDSENQMIFAVNQQLNNFLWLTLAYNGTWNGSNKTDFQYNSQLGLISVEARL